MAIKETTIETLARPIELIRKDFKEFDESDFTVVELIDYPKEFNRQSIRTAAIKVMHEYDDKIKFFCRGGKMFLVKE